MGPPFFQALGSAGWPHRSWFVASDRIPRRCLQKEKRSKDDAMAFSNYWMKGGAAMGSDEHEPWHQPVNDANDATFGSDSWPFLRNSGLGFFRGCSTTGEGVFKMILAAIQGVYTCIYIIIIIIILFHQLLLFILLPIVLFICYYHFYYFYYYYYYYYTCNIV